MPSMPKVRDSSGTMGTTSLPIVLSRMMAFSMRTNAMVVEISRPSVPLSNWSKAESGGTSSDCALRRRAGRLPPIACTRSLRYFISGLVSGGLTNGTSSSFSSGISTPKRSRKALMLEVPIFFC